VNHTDVVDIALLRALVMKCGEEEGLYVVIIWLLIIILSTLHVFYPWDYKSQNGHHILLTSQRFCM
jgi:hypothetical protein